MQEHSILFEPDISAEQSQHWPQSRALSDTPLVTYAVVYEATDGLRAMRCESAKAADALAVHYQQKGQAAWIVELLDDGFGDFAPEDA